MYSSSQRSRYIHIRSYIYELLSRDISLQSMSGTNHLLARKGRNRLEVFADANSGNYIGLKVVPCFCIRSSFGRRVPLSVESNIVSFGIVVVVQLMI